MSTHTIYKSMQDVAPEKIALMEAYGAEVHVQPSVPFSDSRCVLRFECFLFLFACV
jgi:cysteine synthase